MSSRFETFSGNARNKGIATNAFDIRRVMSEKEIQAYLISRDTVRRVQRVSSLIVPRRNLNH